MTIALRCECIAYGINSYACTNVACNSDETIVEGPNNPGENVNNTIRDTFKDFKIFQLAYKIQSLYCHQEYA